MRDQRQSSRELWTISTGHALTHWYPASFFLLLPLIGKEFGLTYSQIGFIVFVDSITTAAANVPAGMLVDTVGQRRLLMALALFGVGLPYLILSVAHSYWLILACVTLTGISNNLWHPTAIPALAELYPGRKGLVLSLHGMAANLGDALAPVAVGAVLAIVSWREVVVINVVPGILAAAAILYFLRHLSDSPSPGPAGARPAPDAGPYLERVKGLLRNRGLVLITLSSGLRSMTQKTLITFLPVYLAYELGYSPLWVGVGMFALQAAGFVAAPIAGYTSDRVGRQETSAASMAITALILVTMALVGKSPLFIALVAGLGFFLFALRPIMQAWMLEVTPEGTAGTSVGLLFGVQSLGNAVAPLVGGLVADRYGLTATFYFVAFTIFVGNLLVLAMPKSRSTPAATSAAAG